MLLLNRTLLDLAKGLWRWIFLIVFLKMVTLVAVTSFAKTISNFLGSMETPSMTPKAAGYAIIAAFAASLVMLCSELLRGETEFRCTAKARNLLRSCIFSKILKLDAGNVEKIGPVSAITCSVDGVEAMQNYYSQYLPGLIYCMCAPIYLFFQLKDISLSVASVLFLISFVLMPVNNVFRSKIEKLKTEYWHSMEDLTGYYLESVRGLTTLKLFGKDQERSCVLEKKANGFYVKIMDVMKVNFLSFLMTDAMIYLAFLFAAVITGLGLLTGAIAFSSALMVLLLSYSFFDSVRQLMGATHTALGGVAAAEKVSDLLNIDTTRPYNPDKGREENAFDGICMRKVSYGYPGREAALKEVSLTIQRGSVTAFAGLSGSGKSTTAGLLMRFFDPVEGKIFLEGRDYISYTPLELRKYIIMVPQYVSLFSGTLAENLRIARIDATEEELMEVLEKVRLKDWVDSLPYGLDTQVGDAGGKLSGGQRQKVGIARALLSQAEYIIFDEATSSVDRESEKEIWNCIEDLALTRTLIIISHRLSAIRNADQIYVLQKGGVLEQGSHEELMGQKGMYFRMVQEQKLLEAFGEGGDRQ